MDWEDFPRLRTKTTGGDLYEYEYEHTTYKNGEQQGDPVLFGPWTQPLQSTSVQTGDTVTPNFTKRIAAGEIINNNFQRDKVTYNENAVVPLSCTRYWDVGNDSFKETVIGEGAWSSSYRVPYLNNDLNVDALNTAMAAEALQSAHANVSQSEMLALASLAEGKKTIEFAVSTLRTAYSIFKAVRKFDIQYLKKQISRKELENRYMELRYALRPLIYDVKGVVEVLNKERGYTRMTARGKATRSANESDSVENHTVWVETRGTINRSHSYMGSSYAGILCDVEVTTNALLGLDSILETVWDLTPFSFVLDWFVDVGQAIAASTPKAGVRQLTSWVTTQYFEWWSNRVVSPTVDPASGKTGTISYSPYHTKVREYSQRKANPELYVWPISNLSLDSYKLTDLGIIMSRVFGGR